MKTGPDWNDLAYFATVARTGSLARAADALGVSPATLSRRMTALESRLARRLFRHGAEGYALTADGQFLAAKTAGLTGIERQIARWQAADTGPVPVRLSAGTWTALHLAQNLPAYWTPGANWLPEFIYCDFDMDIARREVDIGVRNRRPEQAWVARQQIGTVDYAVFARSAEVVGWIGASGDLAEMPSQRWVSDHHGADVVTRANTPHVAAALARAGIGRVVLPVFIGVGMHDLTLVEGPIVSLRSEQWLVSHHEARNDPPIRAALDAISDYLWSVQRRAE